MKDQVSNDFETQKASSEIYEAATIQHYNLDGVFWFEPSGSTDWSTKPMNSNSSRVVLFGEQTQKAIDNFKFSEQTIPKEVILAIVRCKKIAAQVNTELGLLPIEIGNAIQRAALYVMEGHHLDQFPVDVFQTGSGTSTNMNVNEVLAALASIDLSTKIDSHDHVNLGQSSNDTFPSAIHISAAISCKDLLMPALQSLSRALDEKALAMGEIIKMGRTHLMDALPIPMAKELEAWSIQIKKGMARIESTLPRLFEIPQGGTAVGSGVNTHPEFAHRFVKLLAEETHLPFKNSESFFEGQSCQDTAVELSGQLKTIAVSLTKIANDLRWMNSGPIAGLKEITIVSLQDGSSIIPGKSNPVILEAVMMAAAQVIGNDTTITLAGQSGNFQLNVMLPLISLNILNSLNLLTNACNAIINKSVLSFEVNNKHFNARLNECPFLATTLTPLLGYQKVQLIIKLAQEESRPLIEVAHELSGIPIDELKRRLDERAIAFNRI